MNYLIFKRQLMKNILTASLFLIFCISGISQNRLEKKAQMDALKVKFFTQELELSSDESEKFWPIYYAFENTKKGIKKSIKAERKKLSEEKTSESDLNNSAQSIYDLECTLSGKKKKFIENCIPILGVKKTAKLINIEDKLRKIIAERVKIGMENR